MKRAGSIKKYCKLITVVNSENDLSVCLFEGVDVKSLMGICDYDAMAFVQNNSGYSLVSSEAFLSSLSMDEHVHVNVMSVIEWLISNKICAIELIDYICKLMNLGCLYSINRSVIYYLSDCVSSADETLKEEIYSKWDNLLTSISGFPDKQKKIIIQAISEAFASFEGDRLIERGIFRILTIHILNLRNLTLSISCDERGKMILSIEKIKPDDSSRDDNNQ